jgi:hypothetical protein
MRKYNNAALGEQSSLASSAAKPGLKDAWRSGVKFLDSAPLLRPTVLDDMHPGM